jgi:hypothetical protein
MKPNNAGCPELVKTCEDQLLLKPEVQEFASSQSCLAEATVIAFGIEGVTQHFQYRNVFSTEQNELGVVVLRPSTKPFCSILDLYSFYYYHIIKVLAIQTRDL